jgi:hypothetical protein
LNAAIAVQGIDAWVKGAQIAQGFSTPVIAASAAVITFLIQRRQAKTQEQQAKTQRLQHRLALLDRRMKVFNATLEFISKIVIEGKVDSHGIIFKFASETRECYLLFGSEIREYIDELSNKAIYLNTIHAMRNAQGVMRPEDVAPFTELLKWFAGQTKIVEQKFLKYIDFREP